MKTRDEAIRDLADEAKDQCKSLADKMTAVINEMDDEGEPETDVLRGISKDFDGRAMLVFTADDAPKGHRHLIYVDDILALAKLLNGEVQVRDE